MMQIGPILSFAWRDLRSSLRGGLRGFRIFLICLALGATMIAGVGSLSSGINAGIANDGKAILGGDLEFRLIYQPASDAELAALQQDGSVSHSLEMRAMLRPGAKVVAMLWLQALRLERRVLPKERRFLYRFRHDLKAILRNRRPRPKPAATLAHKPRKLLSY